jgi:hypothetical protein
MPCHCLGFPSFVFSDNMSQSDIGQTIAKAATSQVKLCPYNEEELAILFRLIEAQFAAVGIKSQKLRYSNVWSVCLNKSFGTF